MEDKRAERRAVAGLALEATLVLAMLACGAVALYMATRLFGWIPVAVIVVIAFSCPWLAYPFMSPRAVRRHEAMLRENRARSVLTWAARLRARTAG